MTFYVNTYIMKKLLFALAIVPLLFAACEPKTKTIRLADFTVTYPASLEIMHQSNGFPDDAAIFFQGENGQIGMNMVVYYADSELEYLEGLYGSLPAFVENKLHELFNNLVNGAIVEDLTVEDVSEIEWTDDEMNASFLFSGTREDGETPFIGGITIYMYNGALVSSLALGSEPEEVEELQKIATDFEFAPHEGSYEPGRNIAEEEEE